MYDQSFNRKSLGHVFQRLDFRNIKSGASLEAFRDDVIGKAVASVASGFIPENNPLRSFPLNGKQVFIFQNFWDEIIARKICSNIKRVSRITSRGRSQIVARLSLLLEEGVPFCVYRLDVKSFYESFDSSYVINKIEEISGLGLISKRLILGLLSCHVALGGSGIPRGLALSAILSDLLMRDFDFRVINDPDVFFFSRYVDDIILVTSAREDVVSFHRKLENMLPPGLHFSSSKKNVCEAKNSVSPVKSSKEIPLLLKFDYLGYSFRVYEPVKNNNKKLGEYSRVVKVDIARNKIKRFKTRMSRSFLDFSKTGDWFLLRDRIKFLTKNYSVYNAKAGGKKIAGIFHSYPLASSDADGLVVLDRFLRNAILSKSGRIFSKTSRMLSADQKRELLSNSFVDGHKRASFVHFSGLRFKEIQVCWVR